MQKHSVLEVLDILEISRTTLYNRLDKLGENMNKHVTMHNGKKYISSRGVDILRENKVDILNNVPNIVNEIVQNNDTELLKKEIENLNKQLSEKNNLILNKEEYLIDKNNQIENLQHEINNKNNQINELIEAVRESRESVREAHKLNENNQMLLRESQQRVLMLENNEQKEKGFWKKLFKN